MSFVNMSLRFPLPGPQTQFTTHARTGSTSTVTRDMNLSLVHKQRKLSNLYHDTEGKWFCFSSDVLTKNNDFNRSGGLNVRKAIFWIVAF